MKSNMPLACNMNVFTSAERESHVLNTAQLSLAVHHIHEVENGFEFIFPNETELITRLGEFISMERLCCPFLEFALKVTLPNEPISLTLTGPEGTPEFLRAEFSEIFA